MSKGHGSRQKVVVAALVASESARTEGVSVSALLSLLGGDPANARRVIRSLVRRGDAELVEDEAGERRLKMPFLVCMREWWKREPPGYGRKGDTERMLAEEKRALEEAANDLVAREQEKRRGHILRDRAVWAEPGDALKRHRSPGPHQTRVIAVLVAYAQEPQEGLPRAAVLKIAAQGSGEANATRALDRLLVRGTLQQTRDGERVRLADWRLSWLWSYAPGVVEPSLDDAKAKAILEGFGEDGVDHVSG